MNHIRKLKRFLLSKEADDLTATNFRVTNLGAYAHLHLPLEHLAKSELRSDYVAASMRHSRIREQMIPMVAAWSTIGINVAFLKGFRFAEFEYPRPAERFYGDVDVLILPNDVEVAKKIAIGLGWSIVYDETDALWTSSHAAVLQSSDGLISLELHCVVFHSHGQLSKQIASAFWAGTSELIWSGISIRQLQPVDAVLCMYLNRAWGDYYGRKVHDILDVRVIIENYGLTREQLLNRANEVGVLLALKVALRTCDPWQEKLVIGTRSKLSVWWDAISAFANWRCFAFDRLLLRMGKAHILLVDVLEGWRLVRVAKIALAKQTDLESIAQSMIPLIQSNNPDPRVRILRLERGVRWALRLMNQHIDSCVPRSLALFHALRREGLEVSFVSGVRRNGTKLEGHAWLELNGKPLVGLGDENAPVQFKENFRFPKS